VTGDQSADLRGYADFVRPYGGKQGIIYAAKYTSPSGRSYFGYNGHDLIPTPGGVVDNMVNTLGKLGHIGCAETMCLILAENAEGAAAFGGRIDVMRVRGPNATGSAHGTTGYACETACVPRLRALGIDFDKAP
jgi:hypothetical protein